MFPDEDGASRIIAGMQDHNIEDPFLSGRILFLPGEQVAFTGARESPFWSTYVAAMLGTHMSYLHDEPAKNRLPVRMNFPVLTRWIQTS